MTQLSKEQFMEEYIAAFLGSYAALHYDENCQMGWQHARQPVDDARMLAEEAWDKMQKV